MLIYIVRNTFKYLFAIIAIAFVGGTAMYKLSPIVLTDREGPYYYDLQLGNALFYAIINVLLYALVKWFSKSQFWAAPLFTLFLPGCLYFLITALTFGYDFRGLALVTICIGFPAFLLALIDQYFSKKRLEQ